MKVLSLVLAICLASSALAELPRYKAVPLVMPDGRRLLDPEINNLGTVIGGLFNPVTGSYGLAKWNSGQPEFYPASPLPGFQQIDINNADEAVMLGSPVPLRPMAYVNGLWSLLPPVDGYDPFINDLDQVLVTSGQSCYVWQNGVYSAPQAPFFMDHQIGRGINNQGVVLGITEDYERIHYKQFLWTPGQTPQEISIPVFGWDINDLGHIGGEFGPYNFGYWDGTQIQDCGRGRFSHMNNVGSVIGSDYWPGSGDERVLWHAGERAFLRELIEPDGHEYRILGVHSINDSGWITATDYNGLGVPPTPVLLVPVPEPTTLIAVGLGALIALSRRPKI